jgi:ElaB/YqjD/DUF883 family membrane-anchored ribosome-binding protein
MEAKHSKKNQSGSGSTSEGFHNTLEDAGLKLDALTEKTDETVQRAKRGFAALQETARAKAAEADVLINENIYTSLGIALGLGVVVGALLCGGNHKEQNYETTQTN